MKKIVFSAGVLAAALAVCAAKNNDPVLMTVNGRQVHKSEFEYLYHKNNSQQLQPQTLEQYVDMFVDYKLKVADAEAAGIDTTKAFLDEYNKFRNELADPYMSDEACRDSLIAQAYEHQKENVKVSHIMMAAGNTPDEQDKAVARLDSIRRAIVDGSMSWGDAVKRYSIDRSSNNNNGSMGWMNPGRFPWPFEEAAYNTKVGEISGVVNSGYGIHIIHVDQRRQNPGEVEAAHILKLTARKSEEDAAKAKFQIDSIYNVVKANPAAFNEVAKAESEDPGSRDKGGELGYFGPGMMVAQFDSVAFALNDGEISEPFKTSYGYHIIYRTNHRPIKSFEEMRTQLEAQVNNGERALLPRQRKTQQLVKKYKAQLNEKSLTSLKSTINANAGGYDSAMVAQLKKSTLPMFTVNGKSTPLSEVMPGVVATASKDADNAVLLIRSASQSLMERKAQDAERDNLAQENTEYRNLVNEYRDGILLFEIANRNVWERAAADKEGLEAYFKANKDKYQWTEPKFKGYVVFATGDSIMEEAKTYSATVKDLDHEAFVKAMRDKFGRDVRVERVIAAKGENAITDYLAFGGELPQNDNLRWKHYFAFNGRIINQPEEAADVRGLVTTDYQNQLEADWVKSLRSKYTYKIDQKVLKQVN